MPNAGFLYVLINPSLPGLVKIGKTYRDPESRARELSQATGVATAFHVAYSLPFADCDLAESYVHLFLEQRGFRLMPNREFFQMPLQSAIELVLETQRTLSADIPATPTTGEMIDSLPGESTRHPAFQIFEQALESLCGLGDAIQDKEEAIRLLLQAKVLNFPAAYTTLAEVHFDNAPDAQNSKALNFLKEGAAKGHGRCFVEMTGLYTLLDRSDDAAKCWKRYFTSATFRNDDDQRWTDELTKDMGFPRIFYVVRYLHWIQLWNRTIPDDILGILRPLREELVTYLQDTIACRKDADVGRSKDSGAEFRFVLDFVDRAF